MQKTTTISVRKGTGDWVSRPSDPTAGTAEVRFLRPWILGNWGYNEGDVVRVSLARAQKLVANGVAVKHVAPPPVPEPVQRPVEPAAEFKQETPRRRGRPKGSRNKVKE